MLPHGEGLDRPFQTFPSLAARSPPIQNPDPRKLSGLPTRKFLGKGTCPIPCSVEFPPLCGVSSRIPLWGGRAGAEYFWHFYKVPEQTKQWQRYLKSNGMQATKLWDLSCLGFKGSPCVSANSPAYPDANDPPHKKCPAHRQPLEHSLTPAGLHMHQHASSCVVDMRCGNHNSVTQHGTQLMGPREHLRTVFLLLLPGWAGRREQ